MPANIDISGQVPPEFSNQIISEATQASAVLSLANRIPMGTGVLQFPVPHAFPSAGFVSAPGGAKPWTDLALSNEVITAEEIAAVISIPDTMVDDSSINLWNYARPLLAEAIGATLDNAVLWGVDAPATFPAGGIAAYANDIAAGIDAVDTINQAMSSVENEGLQVTGSAADISVRGALRGVRDASQALLLGTTQVNGRSVDTLYGVPITYVPFSADRQGDFVTGAWRYLMLGVRQDIRYAMSTDGVILNPDGTVAVSAFQNNVTLMKVWARFGAVIVKPVTRRNPDGANPFAIATELAADPAPPSNGGDSGSGDSETMSASATRTRVGRE